MTDKPEYLTEEESRLLWERAAQLQAEEARRAEARKAVDPARDSDGASRDGYALTHVRDAALEAGIGEEFVEAALAEVQAARLAQENAPGKRRLSRWLLGSPSEALVARRVIEATPEVVLGAMERLLPAQPYGLVLRERLGDPGAGGTLVFDIEGVGIAAQGAPGFRGDASKADLRQVLITVSRLPGEDPRTDVTVRAPIAWAFRLNAAATSGVSVAGGGLALLLTGAIGSSLAFLGPVGFAVLVAAGGLAGGSVTFAGMRTFYSVGLRRGMHALEALLANLAAEAEGGWKLTSRKSSGGQLPPG